MECSSSRSPRASEGKKELSLHLRRDITSGTNSGRQWARRRGYFPIRSLIYAKSEINAQAIHISSSDITGVWIQVQGRMIPVISVYVPSGGVHALSLATDLINNVVRQHGQGHELVIAGDFNRHD